MSKKEWHTVLFSDQIQPPGSKKTAETPEKENGQLARDKLVDYLNEHEITDFKVLRSRPGYIEIAYAYETK